MAFAFSSGLFAKQFGKSNRYPNSIRGNNQRLTNITTVNQQIVHMK